MLRVFATMKYFLLAIRTLFLLYFLYLLLFILSDAYSPAQPGYRPPLPLTVLDWINLFIHEAGHLFFSPFGFILKLLGGSLMQLLIPMAAIVVWYVRDRLNAHYFLFWLGESAVNVSVYIGDAPYRKLRLISSGALHDWYAVLSRWGMLDSAETISAIVFGGGILCMIGSLVLGVFAAFHQYHHWVPPPLPD